MKSWEHDQTAAALNALSKDIYAWAQVKGFWRAPYSELAVSDEVDFKAVDMAVKSQKIMLVVTELAELVEGLRKPQDKLSEFIAGGPTFTNEEEEVADAIIRLLDYAGAYGLRIGEALCAKMVKNEGRPFKHGKEF